MNKLQFLSLIKNLIETIKETYSEEILQQIIEHFKKYLTIHPFDTEIWTKFALLFLQLPKDEINAMGCLQKILEYDPKNVIAKILLACFADYALYVDKPIFEIVYSIKTTNQEFLSIIEIEKSWYYSYTDHKMYKKVLLRSIDYCDSFVLNYKLLGLHYLCEEKDIKKARYCFQKALNNIQYVYTMNEHYDPLNIAEFFNERLKGIHTTQPNFESIQELLEICK